MHLSFNNTLKKEKKEEFPLWGEGIGSILGALGHGFHLQPSTVG